MLQSAFRFAALSCLSAALSAQLSGDYTIDPNGTGARNFKSFAAAVQALSANNAKPWARFTAIAGTFTESVSIGYHVGLVTFRGTPPGTTIRGRITLNHATHLTLENLEFQDRGLSGLGNDIEIKGCTLRGGFQLRGTIYEIHGCSLLGAGIEFTGRDFHFHSNTCWVTRPYDPTVRIRNTPKVDKIRIWNNVFTGRSPAISVTPSVENGVDIWHNTFSMDLASREYAIAVTAPKASSWPTIYNNIVQVRGAGSGVAVFSPGHVAMDYNIYDVESDLIGYADGRTHTKLRDWQRALSKNAKDGAYGRFSLLTDPAFAGSNDYRLHPRSPAVNHALVDPKSGNGAGPLLVDFAGLHRGNMRDVGAYELTGHQFFGAGCPGTGGKTPFHDVQGDVGPGKLARFLLTGAKPRASAVFALGLQRTTIPLGGTCSLLTTPLVLLPAPVSPLGETSIQIHMPINQRVGGPDSYSQFGVLDPGAGGLGVAVSRGVRVKL